MVLDPPKTVLKPVKPLLNVVLELLLDVLEMPLEVLDLSWRSWTFTEASEVWVWVDWRPLT